jgi:hypothetical protein
MTFSANASFAKIIENNQTVDQSIENLVNTACALDEKLPRPDRLELEKTMQLMFFSSLVFGERDDSETDE